MEDGEDLEKSALREIAEESGLHDFQYVEKIGEALTHYHNINKNVNRVAKATCFLVILKSGDLLPTKLEAHEKFKLVWVPAKEALDHWQANNQNENYSHWIYFLKKAVARAIELGYDTTSVLPSDSSLSP